MDDDGFPNFGNAFVGASPSTPVQNSASWNPALRPDTEHPEPETKPSPSGDDDDFFDRYPNPTPKKQRDDQSATQSTSVAAGGSPMQKEEVDEESAWGMPEQSQSISVEDEVSVTKTPAAPEEMGMQPEITADADAPISHHDHPVEEVTPTVPQDEDAAVFSSEVTAEEQAWDLEEHMPDVANEAPASVVQPAAKGVEQTDQAAAQEEAHRPEENYDYQGEVTEMEAAQDESAQAPLMDDEEPAPTPGNVSRAATFEAQQDGFAASLEGETGQIPLQTEQPQHPSIERSFTSNFTEPPHQDQEASTPVQRQVVDEDWPAAGDDKTFGELLDDQPQQAQGQGVVHDGKSKLESDPTEPERSREIASDWPAGGDDDAFGEIIGSQSAQRNNTEHANEAPQPHSESENDGWGATGDDPAFNDILGAQAQKSLDREQDEEEVDNTFGELLGHQTKEASPEGLAIENLPATETQPADLNAAFAAALDDDDILDDDMLDPATIFGDDDDGLLEDDDFLGLSQGEPQAQTQQQGKRDYTPSSAQHPFQQATISTPGTPLVEQNMSRSAGTPTTGLYDLHSQPAPAQQPERPALTSAQSFVDKAKGGYQSPYDLPMEVVKPRRRPMQTPQPSAQTSAPPPRSSSFHQPSQTPDMSAAPPVPNHLNGPPAPPQTAGVTPPVPPKQTPKSDSGFFADLPVAPKLRARPSGVFTPQSVGTPTPPMPPQAQFPPQQKPAAAMPPPTRPTGPPTPAQYPAVAGGLSQPSKTPLFPEQSPPTVPAAQQTPQVPAGTGRYSPNSTAAPAAPATASRYSPAPAQGSQAPATASRYSPAPAAQPQAQPSQRYASAPQPSIAPAVGRPSPAQPFAPRTSSPLAMHGRPSRAQQDSQETVPQTPISPPTANGLLSPERRGSTGTKYTPPSTSAGIHETGFGSSPPGPPQRPRTQSPGAVMKTARAAAVSAGHAPSPMAPSLPTAPPSQPAPSSQRSVKLAHRRQFSRDLAFAVPQDERAHDALERWKGHPIFTWSPSGTVVYSFPKQSAFYAAGHGLPSIKCTPGTITMEDATTFMPFGERDAKFPGPLPARSKGKKKELLSWMAGKIEDLEHETEGVLRDFGLPTDVHKCTEEKLVLWKIMRIFVEHDGTLEGSPKIDEEVRKVLLPNLAQMSQVADLQSPGSAITQPDPVDTSVLAQLRQALFEGQRERAVWIAEEKKLWGHALLLASTMGPDMWKQIVASFVRSQVRSSGADARSLAALYQVFAGSAEDCVDELVPPSARAGFLMMSKTDGSRAGNPLEGLDQWRETLALVTSNRTPTDTQSLVALGKLLASYGRSEAAHTCCLFARQLAKHSGADDADASFVLLGANHAAGDANLDSIMLTEIYEYASSLSAPSSTASYIPHLQAYKLMHGQQLAAYGLKQKAESYCNHIDSAIRSTTKPSGYYNQALAQELMSFGAFLSQTPQTAGSGGKFFSKPAMDRVSSGVGSWFTKFVAGDDADSDPTSAQGQGADSAASTPFGAVNTNQSTISRTNSSTELYNPMMANNTLQPAFQPAAPPATAPSRYAPGGAASVPSHAAMSANRYAPSVPSQFAPSRSSMDSDRSYEPQIPHSDSSRPTSSRYNSYAPQPSLQQSPQMLNVPRPEPERASSDTFAAYNAGSRRGSAMSHVSNQSYEPKSMYAESDGFGATPPQVHEGPATMNDDAEGGFDDHKMAAPEPAGDEPQGFDSETGTGYQPPSTGYEPPAYQPYQPEPEPEEEEAPKPKLKPMMDDDDDDDIVARASALKSQKNSEADRQADAAFRAAAEADAARSQNDKGDKKGWFGGWFGGKKEQAPGNGPVRAKLGEESSFYFDKDLNKWVNKKGGADAATPAAATPPPPKGPPSRVASAAASAPPTMGPPSRAASGGSLAAMGSRPPTSSGPVPIGSGPPSNPPSRAGTPASLAGTPPTALSGPGAAGLMPPPRPSSSLSNASSLDDLLGGPPGAGAKKGTVKGGKKKGGRYVDVMASK
ncbi:hypothetical protein WHR41_08442 [Cladosporium halotolerans]|uniref:Protein transport protein sec16 n=1 Tax=Cladosporium halotolerans TaxID=1052096 RepID=A0AB34KH34_9PEZI